MNDLREIINRIEPKKPVFTFAHFEDDVVCCNVESKQIEMGIYSNLVSTWNVSETFINNRYEINYDNTYANALENLKGYTHRIFEEVSPYRHTKKSLAYKKFIKFMKNVDFNDEEIATVFLKIYTYWNSGALVGTAKQHKANVWHLLEAVVSKYGK